MKTEIWTTIHAQLVLLKPADPRLAEAISLATDCAYHRVLGRPWTAPDGAAEKLETLLRACLGYDVSEPYTVAALTVIVSNSSNNSLYDVIMKVAKALAIQIDPT